jgi:hypothetical protein
MIRMAEHFADRVAGANADVAVQIDTACRLAYGRAATDLERATLSEIAKNHGLPSACRLILNSNEFVFVD